jgi:hypothetical protein
MAATVTTSEVVGEVSSRIDEMKLLYAARTRQLLAALHRTQEENTALRAANQSNAKAQYISALQGHAHERELVIDVLKSSLATATGRTVAEVDQLILKKTTGGPKRFRPKSREELGLEISELENKLSDSARALTRLESALVAESKRRTDDSTRLRESAAVIEQQSLLLQQMETASRVNEQRLLLHEEAAAASAEQLEAFADIEDKARRIGQRYRESRDALASLEREMVTLREERDGLARALEITNSVSIGSNSASGKVGFVIPSLNSSGAVTYSALTPGSAIGLSSPISGDLEAYVQKIRSAYGREISELRNSLESLRSKMAAGQEAKDQELDRMIKDRELEITEAAEATINRAKRLHKEELQLVRRELDATLARLSYEHDKELKRVKELHTKAIEETKRQGGDTNRTFHDAESHVRLSETLKNLESAIHELKLLRSEYQKAKDINQLLETELSSVREEVENLRSTNAKSKSTLSSLSHEIEYLKTRLSNYEDESRSRRPSNAVQNRSRRPSGNGKNSITNDVVRIGGDLAEPSMDHYGGGPLDGDDPNATDSDSVLLEPLPALTALEEKAIAALPIAGALRSKVKELQERLSQEITTRKHIEEYLESQRARADEELSVAIDTCSRAESRCAELEAEIKKIKAGNNLVGFNAASASSSSDVGILSISDVHARAEAIVNRLS